ncbi:gll2482 [Gloeobacter violaceus PCC 7421]|uniref:Gll2482 protein n=2 Tax=Gloeobacter violaceus TaxID=33072 RepID=Q7NHQ3_GLOVI|nr:YbjN domain-containing protein [Gloeobacter violaceus]BAC90423.1 gll2482 [Gloeobacter violaceus PCC 7421]
MMEFETEPQRQVFDKILPWVYEIFGEKAVNVHEDKPLIRISFGSAFVVANVYPWREDAVINVRSYVVTNVEMGAELMRFLLRENDDMRFGAFGIDEENDIFFEYAIVGSTCDMPELKAAVGAVAFSADEYDDQIVARWGGERAVDR